MIYVGQINRGNNDYRSRISRYRSTARIDSIRDSAIRTVSIIPSLCVSGTKVTDHRSNRALT